MTHQEIEDRDIVDAYLRGSLVESDRQAFEEHFFTCDECFAQVQTAEKFGAGVREAAASGRIPVAIVEESPGLFWRWPG
jgi:anti-sigma factor RsiW